MFGSFLEKKIPSNKSIVFILFNLVLSFCFLFSFCFPVSSAKDKSLMFWGQFLFV